VKKAKNTLLVIGLAFYVLANVIQWIKFCLDFCVFMDFSAVAGIAGMRYVLNSSLYIILLLGVLGVCPAFLLAKNLRHKGGNVLPIATIAITSLVMIVLLISSLANTIPQYLIMSSVGVIDTYLTLVVSFLENGGLCYLLGGGCVIVGCILTLCDNKKKVEVTQ